jgi:hypothetical protein
MGFDVGHLLTRSVKKKRRAPILFVRDLNLITFRKKRVKAEHELSISLKQIRNTTNHPSGINLLRFEGFHNVEKFIVNVRTVSKLHLDLIQIQKGIFYSQFAPHGSGERTPCGWNARKEQRKNANAMMMGDATGESESLPFF